MSDDEKVALIEDTANKVLEGLSATIANAVRAGVAESKPQTVVNCHCGINPLDHKESHKRSDDFFDELSDMGKLARRVVLTLLITGVVVAVAAGFALKGFKVF